MAAKKIDSKRYREIRNAKVRRDFFVEDSLEAGIVLTGTEVKSIRIGRAQISDAFIRIDKGEVFLYHAHIEEYLYGNLNNHIPYRPRKLILHKKEIQKLEVALQGGGRVLIPLRLYFKKGLIKVQIALCKGKKLYDKREDLKKKAILRDTERTMRYYRS